jgi:hypothetical protein
MARRPIGPRVASEGSEVGRVSGLGAPCWSVVCGKRRCIGGAQDGKEREKMKMKGGRGGSSSPKAARRQDQLGPPGNDFIAVDGDNGYYCFQQLLTLFQTPLHRSEYAGCHLIRAEQFSCVQKSRPSVSAFSATNCSRRWMI